ncbi:TetR/AcrR family transcriptional regulator [Saccharopolyspora rectivirgula]|jgi:AcrR family transcriptional regulator|uniref:TetR family transcriptional regulator n=1 Tax=Saccharopolyspora rectivirgula TaxID=28042 RepID=A0A073B0R3_9PSEU|nr:TetR/AcrR family transcriptional regulator [Saccharopolyspora rectivirgula]KEI44892.1 TetR family transcriptional regulator [Saccharopolyspora rectivirgula]
MPPSARTARNPDEAARAVRAEWRSRQLLSAAARLMARDGFHSVSMQALAEEAEVSVGLIYRYFGNKEELLLAVIVDVLDAFAKQVPAAVAAAGDDPVEQLAAAFRAYCEVIDDYRHAAVLTYRESRTLSSQRRERIKKLEIETGEPLRSALRDGVRSGLFTEQTDVDLIAHDLLLLAHGWALKSWYLEQKMQLADYARKQTALFLAGVLRPEHHDRYQHLLQLR